MRSMDIRYRIAIVLVSLVLICVVPFASANDNNGTVVLVTTTGISGNSTVTESPAETIPVVTAAQITSNVTPIQTNLPTLTNPVRLSTIPTTEIVPITVTTIVSPTEQAMNNDTINSAITDQERKLATTPLMIDDSVDATAKINQLIISESITSVDSKLIQKKMMASTSVQKLSEYEIPQGGIILYSNDDKTRVFSSEGKQLFYTVDSKTERIPTTSGRTNLASRVIGVPSGSIIDSRGNKTYVILEEKILLTCISEDSSSSYLSQSNVPARRAESWVAWAESNTPSPIGYFSAFWILPDSPQLKDTNHILFNGITSEDTSNENGLYIAQPVTAYNFNSNCKIKTDDDKIQPGCEWANKWTGSSWIVYGSKNLDFHTYPPVSFLPGDEAWGYISQDSEQPSVYCIFIENERTSEYAKECYVNLLKNAAYQQFVVAYEAYPMSNSIKDELKMESDVKFTNMDAYDDQGNRILPNWIAKKGIISPDFHGLFVNNLTQQPSNLTLEMGHNLPPVARFTADNCYNGDCPIQQSLKFTSTSYNNPTTWLWNYGDGTTGTGKEVSHIYQQSGMYVVTLTVSNNFGSNFLNTGYTMTGSTVTPTTTPTQPPAGNTPVPSITYQQVNGNTPYTYQFTGSATNSPTSWFWEFGDGTSSKMQTPQPHMYTSTGTKTVRLTATNTYGKNKISQQVVVSTPGATPTPGTGSGTPVASFEPTTTSGVTPLTVQFTDSSMNTPTRESWNYGDFTGDLSFLPFEAVFKVKKYLGGS